MGILLTLFGYLYARSFFRVNYIQKGIPLIGN